MGNVSTEQLDLGPWNNCIKINTTHELWKMVAGREPKNINEQQIYIIFTAVGTLFFSKRWETQNKH